MLELAQVVALVPTRDLVRATRFYRDVLGLPVATNDAYGCTFRAGAALLRLALVGTYQPQQFTTAGWVVPDIVDTVAELRVRGVVFERYERLGQDEDGLWTAPDGALIAWFKDPDGNTLSLSQLADVHSEAPPAG
jgi:catechol 2,3-dioxygenase-like lactoylglutathione lyase family enzyme